jgi:hypothetical protein
MKKSYVIQWKSLVNGRAGRGTKLFDLESAQRLVDELNREYPQIHHEMIKPADEEITQSSGDGSAQAASQPMELAEAR